MDEQEHKDLTPEESPEEPETKPQTAIFGVPQPIFRGGAFGFAVGLILCGLIGIITHTEFRSYLLIVACMVVGGLLGKRTMKK